MSNMLQLEADRGAGAPNQTNRFTKHEPKAVFTREEVFQHKRKHDCWIILEGEVYNVTSWLAKHPGGKMIILHHGGEDATVAWTSFHHDMNKVKKYLKAFHIGSLQEQERELREIDKDFLKLRESMKEKGHFKSSVPFFVAHFLHIFFFFFAAWWVFWYYGNNWATWLLGAVLMSICQVQAYWIGHDLCHRSIFSGFRLNRIVNYLIVGIMKGASCWWWNDRHLHHHAKPNVHKKDPDIYFTYLFLLGIIIPEKWGRHRWGFMPYRLQHYYFFFIVPPMLVPVVFHFTSVFYTLKKRLVKDFFTITTFYLIFHLIFSPLLGGFWANFRWYFLIRFIESHWYSWVTLMSHISMHVSDVDKQDNWVSMQLKSTTDVEASFLVDWFSGHLNFQIVHHLFPTMPRNQYAAVRPYVVEFCKKHGIKYNIKPFWQALADIVISLKESSEIWARAYYAPTSLKSD